MKRTLIQMDRDSTPEQFHSLPENVLVFDSSCSPTARVYYIQKDGG